MKILIYDNKEDLRHFTELMRMIPIKYSLDFVTDFLEFAEYYEKGQYEIVFTELDEEGKKIINFVKQNSPKQKLVILSAKADCSELLGCDHCKTNFNQYRLIKPIEVNDLVHSLKKSSECNLFMCDDKFILDLLILTKPFKSFVLDKNDLRLNEIGDNTNQIVKDKIYLSQILSTNNINFSVLEDHIKVYKPSLE